VYTAPQRRLIKEYRSSRFAPPKQDAYTTTKMARPSEHSRSGDKGIGNRSGSLVGPVKPKHQGLSGIGSPHETRATKPGKPAPTGTRPEGASEEAGSISSMNNSFRGDPSGMKTEGEPMKRGYVANMAPKGGDNAEDHPSKGTAPKRVQGPAQDSGRQSWTGFGNRYAGNKIGNFN